MFCKILLKTMKYSTAITLSKELIKYLSCRTKLKLKANSSAVQFRRRTADQYMASGALFWVSALVKREENTLVVFLNRLRPKAVGATGFWLLGRVTWLSMTVGSTSVPNLKSWISATWIPLPSERESSIPCSGYHNKLLTSASHFRIFLFGFPWRPI